MHGRVLALLVAGFLTMGAVSAPDPGYTAPDRSAAQHELDLLSAAASAPGASEGAVAVAARADSALEAVSPDPARTAAWWAGLPAPVRTLLEQGAPQVVGDLEGLPYAVRDAANRAVLASATASAAGALALGEGKGEAMLLHQRLVTLQQVTRALVAPTDTPARYLVTFDPTGDTRAAVAVGDPQTAAFVDVLVPGMFFSVRDQLVDWTDTAAAVQAEATAWLGRLHDARRVAVVSWIGYRTPDASTVLGIDPAQGGAVRLTDAVDGVKAARAGDAPFVGVLAHSYGATTALLALQAHAFSADALAMVGAPGSPASGVHELAVPADAVFVGRAELDSIATSGFFGSDPMSPSYGATVLGARGGVDPVTHAVLAPAVGHNGYFAAGTESLRNIALIAIGRGSMVTDGRTASAATVLALSH